MKSMLLLGTLLLAGQVMAGGSQVGNAGEDSLFCNQIADINSYDHKLESVRGCIRHIEKMQTVINSYQNIVQSKKNQLLTIAAEFDKEGNQSAASFYRNFAANDINWRASSLASTVSDTNQFFFEMPSERKSSADIVSQLQAIHQKPQQELRSILAGLEADPSDDKALTEFSRAYSYGYQGLTNKFVRGLIAEQSGTNSVFTKVLFPRILNIDKSCFASQSPINYLNKEDRLTQIMQSTEANVQKALHVDLITEKDFVGRVLANNTTAVCQFVTFKHSQNFRQINEFRSQKIENSKYARFQPSVQIDANLKTITFTQSKLVSDGLCDLHKSSWRCIEPDAYYDYESFFEMNKEVLENLRQSLN